MTAQPMSYPFARDDMLEPAAEFSRLRVERPVVPVELPTGGNAWLLTRYEDVRQVLGDPRFARGFGGPQPGGFASFLGYLAVFAAPEAQARFRRVAGKALLDCADQMRPAVSRLVDEALSELAAAGPPADLVGLVQLPVSIGVICELIGVPHEYQHTFRSWADTFLSISPAAMDQEKAVAAQADMDRYVRGLLAERAAAPGDDYLSTLLTTPDVDGVRMSEEEVIATTYALLVSGYQTVAHSLGKGMLALFRNPEQLAALRADPQLAGSAVEEFLRFAPPDAGFGMPLHATTDLEVAGVPIAAGESVLVGVWSANRDEETFPKAHHFDVARRPNQHLSFGIGIRYCTGAALARLQMELVLTRLLERFPRLALAVPAEQVEASSGMVVEGPKQLPVTW
ncbi:cytochrome P450 [Micromonospora zingiberis]|nr:cytochrome P450 [Micromonospora zingiberis]